MIVNRLATLVLIGTSLLSNAVFAKETLTDPTMPANYSTKSVKHLAQEAPSNKSQIELKLNSTIISPYQKIAVINGKQLKVGEEISGATITQISHQHVVLNYEGKEVELLLQSSFISQVNAAKQK